MRKSGFTYIPVVADEDDERNIEIIDSLDLAQRELYFRALNGTGEATPDIALGCLGSYGPQCLFSIAHWWPLLGRISTGQ